MAGGPGVDYLRAEQIEIIIQPLDGYCGNAVGTAYSAPLVSASVNPDQTWVDKTEIRPNDRNLTDSRLDASAVTFEFGTHMRAPRENSFYGWVLRAAMGITSARPVELDALASTLSGTSGTITGLPDGTFTGVNVIQVGDFIFAKPDAAADWVMHRVVSIVDPDLGGNAAEIELLPAPAADSASWDFRMTAYIVGPATQYADIYIKRGADDGEVARSCHFNSVSLVQGGSGVMLNCSGAGNEWQKITAGAQFPPVIEAADYTPPTFQFSDYDEASALPLGMTWSGDMTVGIDNQAEVFQGSNRRNPVGSILGVPNITLSGSMFIDPAYDIKVLSEAETDSTVAYGVSYKNGFLAVSAGGVWRNPSGGVDGPRQLLTNNGELKVTQTNTSTFTIYGADTSPAV